MANRLLLTFSRDPHQPRTLGVQLTRKNDRQPRSITPCCLKSRSRLVIGQFPIIPVRYFWALLTEMAVARGGHEGGLDVTAARSANQKSQKYRPVLSAALAYPPPSNPTPTIIAARSHRLLAHHRPSASASCPLFSRVSRDGSCPARAFPSRARPR